MTSNPSVGVEYPRVYIVSLNAEDPISLKLCYKPAGTDETQQTLK